MPVRLRREPSLSEKSQWLKSFQPWDQTLVVSDLKSKLEIQRIFLQQGVVLEEDSILRATELWRKLLVRCRPDLRLVSHPLATTLIRQWIKDGPSEWNKGPGVAGQLVQYVQQFVPMLVHPQGDEIMEEWFSEHPLSFVRWGTWYRLAREIWNRFAEEGLAAANWTSGFLAAGFDAQVSWDRSLIFDLGAELSGVEVDIIKQLGQSSEVTVICPDPTWAHEHFSCLWPYQMLEEDSPRQKLSHSKLGQKFSQDLSPIGFRKYTTMVAEVKAMTAQVRKWLDQGVDPRRVAICAPDSEIYWRAVRRYFEVEGIPVDKDVVSTIAGFPEIMRWLSTLRLTQGQITSWDLESHLFFVKSGPPMDYDTFARLLSIVYDERDLERVPDIAKLFAQKQDLKGLMVREEFLAWALKQWDAQQSTAHLEMLLQRFLQDCPAGLNLSLEQWCYYLETTAARQEILVQSSPAGGVHFINLSSAENLNVDYLYILGMTEESLRQTESTALTLQDILDLSRNTGFHLHWPDKSNLEFAARWLLTKSFKGVILSYPASDFAADVQSPPLVWLMGRLQTLGDTEQVDKPEDTRWDELQRAPLEEMQSLRAWNEERAQLLHRSLLCDLGLERHDSFGGDLKVSLSVSQLENYLKCPFIFAANKLFHLSDLPSLDVDVDHMTRGQLMHALFEALTIEPMRFNWSDEELEAILDRCREENQIQIGDERVWKFVKGRHKDLAKRFLDFERQWRAQFPRTKTVARELPLQVQWDPKNKKFSADGDGITFRGYVDRVDSDGDGNYVVIDYKSSSGDIGHHHSWIEKQKLQLPLYSALIESGLSELPPGPVVGAFYYVSKSMEREKGFRRSDASGSLFKLDKSPRNLVSCDQVESLYQQVHEMVDAVVTTIQSGNFHPEPRDVQDCAECKWRSVCRAPHLS